MGLPCRTGQAGTFPHAHCNASGDVQQDDPAKVIRHCCQRVTRGQADALAMASGVWKPKSVIQKKRKVTSQSRHTHGRKCTIERQCLHREIGTSWLLVNPLVHNIRGTKHKKHRHNWTRAQHKTHSGVSSENTDHGTAPSVRGSGRRHSLPANRAQEDGSCTTVPACSLLLLGCTF